MKKFDTFDYILLLLIIVGLLYILGKILEA